MNMQELNALDFSNIGQWPAAIKAILILILMGGVGAAWYFLDIEDQYKALAQVENTEKELRLDFEGKQAKAANLEAYRAQLAEMEESFGAMLRQLPNRTEVADLLWMSLRPGLQRASSLSCFSRSRRCRRTFMRSFR